MEQWGEDYQTPGGTVRLNAVDDEGRILGSVVPERLLSTWWGPGGEHSLMRKFDLEPAQAAEFGTHYRLHREQEHSKAVERSIGQEMKQGWLPLDYSPRHGAADRMDESYKLTADHAAARELNLSYGRGR